MAFNLLVKLTVLFLSVLILGCSAKKSAEIDVIGSPVSSSSLAIDQTQLAAFYDSSMGLIQEFDVDTLQVKRQIEVQKSGLKHSVLISADGSYVLDLAKQHLAIYPSAGTATLDPVRLVGNPLSVAYDSASETMVVYDDLASVAMLKMSNAGQSISAWVGGPLVGDSSIRAGDFEAGGKLVLSFSNDTMAVADVSASISAQSWNSTTLNTGLTGVNWVAPIAGQSNLVMLHSDSGLNLVNTISGASVAQYPSSGLTLLKLSKQKDPHAIFLTSSGAIKMVYLNGSTFAERTLTISINYIMFSLLDIAGDSWRLIDRSQAATYSFFNSANEFTSQRRLLSYRLSDLLVQGNYDIGQDAEVGLTSNYLFSLYPSKLGYATRLDISSGTQIEVEKFNYEIYRRRTFQ